LKIERKFRFKFWYINQVNLIFWYIKHSIELKLHNQNICFEFEN